MKTNRLRRAARSRVSQQKFKKAIDDVNLKVLAALEDDKFRFRTVHGVMTDTGLTEQQVKSVIQQNPEKIVTVFRKSAKGEALLTTRKHYEETSSIKEKVIGALINRVY